MIKFIHCADIHLDSPLHRLEAYDGAPVDQIRQASRRALENLVDLAVGEAVDFVLIAGDLFDGTWKDYHTGLYFISQVTTLKDAGIDVFIISGNHDAAGRMTRTLPYPENVHVFSHRKPETHTLNDLKVAVHGQSFGEAAVSDNLAANYPEPLAGFFNIGLLHTSLTGREGHENYAPCTVADLENRGYDYWALGHVHQFEIVAEDPPVVFPGCIQGRHIKESGARGCVLVTAEAGALPQVVHHPLDVIRWELLTVDLGGVVTRRESLVHFKDALETRISRNEPHAVIARVVFTGETEAHGRITGDPQHWTESVRSTALAHFGNRAWIEKVSVRTTPKTRGGHSAADPGPLLELEQLVEDLKADDGSLLALGDSLAGLFRKLPAEYRQGDASFGPEDTQRLRRIVDQARGMLVRRLKKEAAGP